MNLSTFDKYFESSTFQTIIYTCITLAIALFLSQFLCHIIRKNHKRSDNLPDHPGQIVTTLVRVIVYGFAFYCIISQIKPLQTLTSAILASSSVIAVVVSIAAQDTVGNFVAGVAIIATHPFTIGDLIKINNSQYIGFVEDITLQHTLIRTYENVYVTIPNAFIMKSPIINEHLVDESKNNYFEMEISYDSDIDEAIRILKDIITAQPECLNKDSVSVDCVSFEPSGLVLRTVIHTDTPSDGYAALKNIRYALAKTLRHHPDVHIACPRANVKIDDASCGHGKDNTDDHSGAHQ